MSGFGWSISRPEFFEKFYNNSSPATASRASGKQCSPGNLIFIAEDVCYIWWCEKKILVRALCSDIWMNADEVSSQEYPLIEEVNFKMTHLTGRKHPNELLLAWGPSGLASIKFQSKPGFQNPSMSCSVIAEKTYVERLKLRILQVKLHPTRKQDLVAVLNNDYFVRLYNINNPTDPISVVCVGPPESRPFTFINHSVGLPEPPVDFEFGPRLSKSGLWVVFILKSSGTVSFRLLRTLDATNRCLWEPEQIIYTDGDLEDAFEDAASLLVSKTFPPVLTIACLNGNLYHTVLLPSENDTPEQRTELSMEDKYLSGDLTLFVKEILELEPESERGFSTVRLSQDPLCSQRYSCIHDEGVHLINMHFMVDITNFLAGETCEGDDSDIGPRSCQQSTVRYVLCTINGDDDSDVLTIQEPELAKTTFSESVPQKFLVLLKNGILVCEVPHALENFRAPTERKVDDSSTLSSGGDSATPSKDSGKGRGQDESINSLNILEVVKKYLNKSSNQPYLMAGNEGGEEFPTEKNETLLMDGARILKWEYLQRQEQTMTFLKESLEILERKSLELKESVENLDNVQADLRNGAEGIAELYEEGSEREEGIHKRLEAILLRHHQALPLITDDEKAWLRTMEALQTEVKNMKLMVVGLKRNTSSECPRIEHLVSPDKQNTGVVSAAQMTQIREQVLEQHNALASLAHSMKEFEKKIALT